MQGSDTRYMSNESPILHTPYEEPSAYHMADARGQSTYEVCIGRRPSEASSGMPDEVGNETILDSASIEPHMTINGLRDVITHWRQNGWKGATSRTRRLLEFWHRSDPGIGMRPFWCQMEAIETMIWLFEAGQVHDPSFHKKVMQNLRAVNDTHNDGVQRTAFKMATGTGKTNVMAMAMLWILANNTHHDDNGITNFLIIAPNLTVRKRLEILNPKKETELWNAITPREFRRMLGRAQVTIVNFHVFQRRIATMDGKSLGAKEKKMLGRANVENFRESEIDMINRVLHEHDPESKVIVINDEAHHCYKPRQERQSDTEYTEYQKAAALWFNALMLLKKQGRLVYVHDFSATPMWLVKPKSLESVVFPWTVSDFPLLDAIESGLVKIPRVPIKDNVDSHHPKYRNVYEYNSGKPLTSNLTVRVQEPLEQLYKHYHDVINPKYSRVGIMPIFIVVANNIKNAAAIYRWVAGSHREDGRRGARGHLELFSNYDQNGNPLKRPPTLLVHSRLFEKTPTSSSEKKIVDEQAVLFGLEGSLDKKQEQIRGLFTSVGQIGIARHIRCVISVGMLTEGWDAKNVTHVFGYRRFGSQLLCEQVTGRALRRTSFVGSGKQGPEYANVFGVPYTFARGGDVPPQPPAQPYKIFSVTGNEKFRISFPNITGYENPRRQRRFTLNPDKVTTYEVKPEPIITVVQGPAGKGMKVVRERRVQTAIWDTACRVAELLNRDSDRDAGSTSMTGRNTSFVDSCRMVQQWLEHPNITCNDKAGVMADSHVPQKIAEACDHDNEIGEIRPVFADESQSGERLLTTEGVRFRTTLQYTYKKIKKSENTALDDTDVEDVPDTFLRKSELSRAACHSSEESEIAKILDSHPDIEAWARNFRLGFKIRWFDESQNAWRDTEPDFVARVKAKKNDRSTHLVIEFKGMKKGESEEQAKRYYMENWWCPAVSAYNDSEYGKWKCIWIENMDSAKRQISEACTI